MASYDYGAGPVFNNDAARAHWWGVEAGASRLFWEKLRISLGAEVRQGSELKMTNYDLNPFTSYLDVKGDETVIGSYADSHWQITKSLSLSGGVRWDHYESFGNTINPRAALIWKPREGTTLKLLYGQMGQRPRGARKLHAAGGDGHDDGHEAQQFPAQCRQGARERAAVARQGLRQP